VLKRDWSSFLAKMISQALWSFVWDCLDNHVGLKRWDDALDTVKRSLDIVQSHSRARSQIISAGLYTFHYYLGDSPDFAALPATCRLIDTLRPFHGSNHSDGVH